MTYDPKKHHRRSIRLQSHNYAQPNAYYITICTKERKEVFGRIVYHEHIIRNDYDLNRIRQYIIDNPARWEEDELNTQRGFLI